MPQPTLAIDLKSISSQHLVEATEYCYLDVSVNARAKLAFGAIRQEHEDRGSAHLLRAAIRRVARQVVHARRTIDRSPEVRSVKSLQRMLRFIVKRTLATGEAVKQESITAEVFQRMDLGAGAVSTEIRRLRDALARYYMGSGLGERIRFHIPKGRCIAVVTRMALLNVPQSIAAALQDQKTEFDAVPLNELPGISVLAAVSPSCI